MRLKRTVAPDALEATPGALEAKDKLTEDSRNSGCVGSDRQTGLVRLKRTAAPDALEATRLWMLWMRVDLCETF